MKWKVAAVVLLLAVGLGTVGFVLFAPGGNAQAQNQFLTAAVTRGNVTQQVVATGSVRSAATYNLAFGSDPVLSSSTSSSSSSSSSSASSTSSGSSGGSSAGTWLVKGLTVAVGDRVAKGDVLATADTANAKAALDLAKANLAVAKARLAVDKAGLTGAQRAAAFDSIRQAQQQLKVARQSQTQTADQNDLKLSQTKAALAKARQQLLDDQTAGPASATISADQAAITQAQQQLDTLNLQISGSNTEAGATSQQNALKLSQAQAALATAQQQNQLKLSQAQDALASAQQKLATDLAANPQVPSAISADQAAVTQAQQQLDTLNLQIQAAVDQAQQQLDTLNLQIQAANTQTSVTDQQTQLKLSQAQAALATAQQKLADDQAAGPADSTIKADQSAIDQAQQQLDTLQLSISASGSSAANQLASAQLSLSSSQNSYSTKVAAADASTIATDRASVTGAQSSVTGAQDTLKRSTLASPVDGVVTAVNIVTGATAPASADLAVASLQMEVSATVTESDYPSLKLGQAVSVAITALGQTATGTVKEIDPIGTSSGTGGVVSYPIIVTVDPVPDGTASGMSADIDVTTAQADNVLSVPAAALNGSNGNYSVRVLGSDGVATAQVVQVGLVTSSFAEITGGLTEGQTVVTGVNTARTGTTTTTTGGGFGGGLGLPVGGGGGGFRGGGNGNGN
jgi:RND family efflux transporter, MFP subunit